MIRKMFAVLLTLALLLCCVPALGDEAAYTAYTHPNQGYSLEYPSECIALDAETVNSLTSSYVDVMASTSDFDFAQIQAQIEAMDIVAFFSLDGSNINVVTAELGMYLTAEMLSTLVLPATQETYDAMLPGCAYYDEGSVCQFGDKAFARMGLTYTADYGTVHMEQYAIVEGTTLYTFTFTYNGEVPAEQVEHVLSSFVPAA